MLALASMFTALAAWIVLGDDDGDVSDRNADTEPMDSPNEVESLASYQSMLDLLAEEEHVTAPVPQMAEATDHFVGSDDDDTILADAEMDYVDGLQGDDLIIGATAGGTLDGGAGNDILTGVAAAKDQASGITDLVGDGEHHLIGGEGDDSIMAGAGDIAEGGSGEDVFYLDGSPSDGLSPIQIEDFDPDEDQIIVCIPTNEADLANTWPDRPTFNGTVSVEQSEPDGPYSITVDDVLVASVKSAQPFDSSNVSVIYDGMVGPSLFDIQHGYF